MQKAFSLRRKKLEYSVKHKTVKKFLCDHYEKDLRPIWTFFRAGSNFFITIGQTISKNDALDRQK